MTDFNLRQLIRNVIDDADNVDHDVLVAAVLDRIDESDTREALVQALPSVVHNVASMYRPRTPALTPSDNLEYDTQTSRVAGGQPQRQKYNAGWKVTAHREEAWRRKLAGELNRVWSCSPEPGRQKRLKFFTWDDLEYAAAVRERQAVDNAIRAERFRDLVKIGRESGKATVGELDEETLWKVLGDD